MINLIILLILLSILFTFLIFINEINALLDTSTNNSTITYNPNSENIKNIKNINIPTTIDAIFTCKNDFTHLFKNKQYWKLKGNSIIDYQNDASKIWHWPDHWTNIDHAIYDHFSKDTIFIKDKTANIVKKNHLLSMPINNYWKNAPPDFDCVITYGNSTYFLKDDIYYSYDCNDGNDGNDDNDDPKKINTKWKDIPINCTSAFINNNHLIYGIPHGMPCFVKYNTYFSYDLSKDKSIKKQLKDGFDIIPSEKFISLNAKNNIGPYDYMTNKYTTKQVQIKNSLQHYTIPKTGLYRFNCIGAGCGGRGAKTFNDYKLNKDDIVKILVGQAGTKAPMANTKDDTILPKSNSCSGSGASIVYVNDHLLLVSGGGGGWSSEIYEPPYFSHSKFYTDNKDPMDNNEDEEEPSLVYIVKKIKIEGLEDNSKITIKHINLDLNDSVVVTEYPTKENKNFIYETDFTNDNKTPFIEINFKTPKSDIGLDIDFKVTNKKGTRVDNNIYFYDEDNEPLSVLQNIDKNNFQLNSNNIVNHNLDFKTNFLSQTSLNSKNGGSLALCNSIADLNKHTTEKNIKKTVCFLGGFGGGGSCNNDITSNIISCGGGGGYIGGKGIELPSFFKMSKAIPHCSATGGSSYVHFINKDIESTYPPYFINDYNEGNGEVSIILLSDL